MTMDHDSIRWAFPRRIPHVPHPTETVLFNAQTPHEAVVDVADRLAEVGELAHDGWPVHPVGCRDSGRGPQLGTGSLHHGLDQARGQA